MANFSATPLQDIIDKVQSSPSSSKSAFGEFEMRRNWNDLGTLNTFIAHTPKCINEAKFDKMLEEKQTQNQLLFIDVYQAPSIAVSNTLNPVAFGSRVTTARVPINVTTPIVSKTNLSLANTDAWDSGKIKDVDKLGELLYVEMLTSQMAMAMEANQQCVTHLNTAKANLGGLGFNFPIDGAGNRQIPSAATANAFINIKNNCKRDKFSITQNKTTLLGTTETEELWHNYLKYSVSNDRQDDLQLRSFNWLQTDSFDPVNVTDKGLLYAINDGSLYFKTWVNDYTIPANLKSNDKTLEVVVMPAVPKYNLPEMVMGLYMRKDIINNFGIYGTEASYIDPVVDFEMFIYPVIGSAYSSAANNRPIVSYRLLP